MKSNFKILKYHLLTFPKSLIFRPFKKFDEIKTGNEGTLVAPTVFIVLFGLLGVLDYQYTGFILNNNNPRTFNALIIFVTSILPFFLVTIANWAITTLVDGKGKLKEIYQVIGYALFPIIIARIVALIISNYIVENEIMFYTVIIGIGLVWTLFTLFVGFIMIHQFGLGKTLLTILLTIFSLLVVVFIILLFFGMIQQVLGFLESLIEELLYRIRG